jgi:hypothetical protein
MPVRPPRRPVRVDSLGALDIGSGAKESVQRAIDALIDARGRDKQAASTPTVTRVTLNETKPLTAIPLSLYTDGTDVYWIDSDGNRIQLTANGAVNAASSPGGSSVPYSTYWYSPVWTAGNALDARGPTANQCRALYMGRAPEDISSIQIAWRQTAGAATVTYAEMGIATGAFVPNSTPSLVIRGYVSAATEWGAVGSNTRVLTIPVTGADIAAGDDIWALYVTDFTGTPTIAVSNVTDRLDIGAICVRAATRLSTNLNTAPLAFTLDTGATPAWIAFSLL